MKNSEFKITEKVHTNFDLARARVKSYCLLS